VRAANVLKIDGAPSCYTALRIPSRAQSSVSWQKSGGTSHFRAADVGTAEDKPDSVAMLALPRTSLIPWPTAMVKKEWDTSLSLRPFTMERILEQVHSASSSCTADAWPLNGFENGPNF